MNEISWGKIALLALALAITFYFTDQAGKPTAWPGQVEVMISSQNLEGQPVLKMDSNMLKTLESR